MCSLSIVAACLASITFYVGFYHLLTYVQSRKRHEDLAFALSCFSIGFYDVFSAGLYSADSVQAGAVWQHWQFIALAGTGSFMIWFTSELTDRTSRRLDYWFYAYYTIQVFVMLLDRSPLTWSDVPSVKQFELFGINVCYQEVRPTLLTNIESVVGLLVCLYIFQSLIASYRAGRREESGPVIIGMVCLTAGVINDTCVSTGFYRFFYIIEYAYMCLVLAMAYSLTRSHLRIQAALRTSEEKYRSLINSVPDTIYTVSPEGIILSVSDACRDLFGYNPEEMRGRIFIQYVHPDDVLRATESFSHVIQTKQDSHSSLVSIRIVRQDGTTRWISLNGNVTLDEKAEVVQMQGVLRDITESRKAEEALARLAAAVNAAEESIIVTDTAGTVQYVNPCFEKMTGYSRDEIIGQNPRVLNSGKHDRTFYAKLWATISSGETWHGRFMNRKKDGTLFEEEAAISAIRDASGKIVNYVAVKRDVTLQKALENQLRHSQTMEAVGQLARGVAHDFTNMLVVITNSLHLARARLPSISPEVQQYFDNIATASNRAADLTGQLLAFSHQQSVSLRDVDLNRSVHGVQEMIKRTLEQNVRLAIHTSNEPDIVRIDPGQIDQVIIHLVVNANDAMPNGGRLTIETSRLLISREEAIQLSEGVWRDDMVSGPLAVLTVSDSGTGMTQEVQARIFEPFFTTKGKRKSTGLGLSTVYGIVRQHGGCVSVYSNPGTGSTFTIYLPLINAAENPPESLESPTRIRRPGTVLLVEEEPLGRSVLARILRTNRYTVMEADNPKLALDMAQAGNTKIDLLICDLFLAGADGRKFADNLKRLHPHSKVIFLSGYPATHLRELGLLKAEDTLIAKPFAASVVEPVVGDVLAG